MGVAPQDQPLRSFVEQVGGDRLAVVLAEHFIHHLVCEGVDQPRLALAPVEGAGDGLGREGLARVRRVLGVECAHFRLREVGQREGLGGDIEGTGGPKCGAAGTDLGLVIPDVAHADQRHRTGERLAADAVDKAVAQLAQEGDERALRQAVHFVEQQHQRLVQGDAEAL